MGASIEDYQNTYKQAYEAYVQANYEQAATLIDQVVQNLPDDPNAHLLRGHVYYVLQRYDVASTEYEKVLKLTDEQEIIGFAKNGLSNIHQYQQPNEVHKVNDQQAIKSPEDNNFNSNPFGNKEVEEISLVSPFDMPTDSTVFELPASLGDNPFASDTDPQDSESMMPSFWQEDILEVDNKSEPKNTTSFSQLGSDSSPSASKFTQIDLPPSNSIGTQSLKEFDITIQSTDDETLVMGDGLTTNATVNSFDYTAQDKFSQSSLNSTFTLDEQQYNLASTPQNNLDIDDSFDFEAFESAFGSDTFNSNEDTNTLLSGNLSKSNNIEFLDDFDEFDDLGNIPGFEITGGSSNHSEAVPSSQQIDTKTASRKKAEIPPTPQASERDDELFSITGSQESVPVFTQTDVKSVEANVSVEQGLLAPLENAPLDSKPLFIAGTVGVVSAIVVAFVSFTASNFAAPQQREGVRNTGWAMALAALVSGSASAGFMGALTLKQIRRTTKDLQTQFDAVRQGNLNAQATVYSEDELGQLAAGFNEMARVIFTTTNEAQRKADEQEEAKENLQRQVIRLLDDVEGAARGDLTVQAEVTADVLGAVADAFNLTIQNLRDIVQQVKVAAREVTKGATNSETFARALSSDALRQAEELAVTLNSVQVMTDSIQRVAEAAREAEIVARDASTIALKGGEAVENTVAGILEIRETVAETTRKVKRLAESSQEISKIVALISQIASRTNLLALNASIEAARAGEAGRGFAIVADEVRQLADKSAKSLKEIEQIVMQIQSETGSVMTAMEEGTQQVIKGTKLAEEAKRSLENIIQVANRIDILVRSITTDTVEQTDTSRAVAQVMQSVELTAQETSQEAQRVSGALQHLVGVSRDLIASVERFRVETAESR